MGLASPPHPPPPPAPNLLGKLWDPHLRKAGVAPGCSSSPCRVSLPPPPVEGRSGTGRAAVGWYRPAAALPVPFPPPTGVGHGLWSSSTLAPPPRSIWEHFTPTHPPSNKVTFLVSSSPPSSFPSHGTVPASTTLRGTVGVGVSPHGLPSPRRQLLVIGVFRGFEALCCV